MRPGSSGACASRSRPPPDPGDPETDGRAMAAMVDGLLLDRLAHPPQSHDMLVAAIRQLLAPRTPPA